MSTWEERMAARAAARIEAQRLAEHQAALADQTSAEARFAAEFHPRWRDHDEYEVDYSACRFCYQHDAEGRVYETPYRQKFGGVGWVPVTICGGAFDWNAHEWVGCTCFCHRIDFGSMIALASA